MKRPMYLSTSRMCNHRNHRVQPPGIYSISMATTVELPPTKQAMFTFICALTIFSLGGQVATIPTLPPPNPSPCCQFEADVCGITSADWYWSSQEDPPSPVPIHSGDYFWTNVTDAHFSSATLTGVTPDTVLSINYYINANVTVNIRFVPSGQPAADLAVLNQTGETFESYTATCGTCCGGAGTCDGQAFLVVKSNIEATESFIVAVDNIERDSACHASMPCCYFDDSYMCGFNNTQSVLYAWKFNGTSPPFTAITSPGSSFVYFEVVNYFDAADLSVTLQSHDMVIDNSVIFRANLYVAFLLSETSSELSVRFINADSGKTIELDYVTDTSSTWETIEFRCDSAHGSCCPTTDSCTGHVEIVAFVEGGIGVNAIYAVDAFEVNGKCSAFPGHNVKESSSKRAIEFQPTLTCLTMQCLINKYLV